MPPPAIDDTTWRAASRRVRALSDRDDVGGASKQPWEPINVREPNYDQTSAAVFLILLI